MRLTEQQIHDALAILADRSSEPRVTHSKSGYCADVQLPPELRAYLPRDYDVSYLVVRPDTRELSLLSWCESYHNGSAYDNREQVLPYEYLVLIGPALFELLVASEEVEVQREEQEERRRQLRERALGRLLVKEINR